MSDSTSLDFLENHTFDQLCVGDNASLSHLVTQRDIDLFATVTGDVSPTGLDHAQGNTDALHHVVIQGMWGGGLISAAIGSKLPGPGTVYLGQELRFVQPVEIGDTITASVTVVEKARNKFNVVLDCACINQNGDTVVTGKAYVRAPTTKVRVRRLLLPSVRVARHDRTQAMLCRAAGGAPIPTAVVHPIDASSLEAALAAARHGLIIPILVGPQAEMLAAARAAKIALTGLRLIDEPDARSAAARAVVLVSAGEVAMLMKGDLHTSDFMHAIVASKTGLRTNRRISHVYLMDIPDYPRPLLITDAAINIAPDLDEKAAIAQNAIDLAHVIGIAEPRVAILAAVETVNGKMQSTLDAAALCKMADRGQIKGALLDGPLAFDNAINVAAAREKGIVSKVAGRADILLVPDLEAGNMLAKQLSFMAGANAAGIVLGARVPIILTSRADSAETRLASCALAVLVARAQSAA